MLHAVIHQKVSTIHISQSAQARTPRIFFYWGIQGFSHLLFTLIFNKKLLFIFIANHLPCKQKHFMIIIIILTPPQPRRHKGKWFVLNCTTLMFANGLASVAGRHRYYKGNT